MLKVSDGDWRKDRVAPQLGCWQIFDGKRDALALVLNKAALNKFRPGTGDSGIQSTFRKLLIHEHRSTNPENRRRTLVSGAGRVLRRVLMEAAHIFPYRLGEDLMKTVFGESSANEVFLPRKSPMLYSQIDNKELVFKGLARPTARSLY